MFVDKRRKQQTIPNLDLVEHMIEHTEAAAGTFLLVLTNTSIILNSQNSQTQTQAQDLRVSKLICCSMQILASSLQRTNSQRNRRHQLVHFNLGITIMRRKESLTVHATFLHHRAHFSSHTHTTFMLSKTKRSLDLNVVDLLSLVLNMSSSHIGNPNYRNLFSILVFHSDNAFIACRVNQFRFSQMGRCQRVEVHGGTIPCGKGTNSNESSGIVVVDRALAIATR